MARNKSGAVSATASDGIDNATAEDHGVDIAGGTPEGGESEFGTVGDFTELDDIDGFYDIGDDPDDDGAGGMAEADDGGMGYLPAAMDGTGAERGYETVSADVDTPEGMMALRAMFSPSGYQPESTSGDPLTMYLSRIRNNPILDPESQQKLAVRYKKDNDLEAAQLLVLTNLRLVVKIAREYRRRWGNLLELIQEGNVGLSEAIRRYDPYRHVRFTSYAQYWVRAMILNYLMNHFQPVKIGSTRAGRKLFYNLRKARAQLQREGHADPTPALVAEKLGVSEQDVIDVSRQLDQPALSIDQKAQGYEDTTIGELIRDDGESPEETVARDEFYGKVHEIMGSFSKTLTDPRELALWNMRLMSDNPVTLAELGAEYNISKERIRQIEARLKERFKTYISQRIDGDIATFID